MVILAELEVFHSRPIAPTRRLAIGDLSLPSDPAPGFGGILLGGVAARYSPELDSDTVADIQLLGTQLDQGLRIVQPRVRHRLQTDRIGLLRSRHRLVGDDGEVNFHFDGDQGSPAVHLLAAMYAASETPQAVRHPVFTALRHGMAWRGGLGPELVRHLSGRLDTSSSNWSAAAFENPTEWALGILGFKPADEPDRKEIRTRFRDLLRDAHPDHGATDDGAAERIAELTEARRILS